MLALKRVGAINKEQSSVVLFVQNTRTYTHNKFCITLRTRTCVLHCLYVFDCINFVLGDT